MQSLTVQRPVAAIASRTAHRSTASRAAVVRAAASEQQAAPHRVGRRSLAGLLAAVPVLLPASRALALIPDDDDEELVEKARANRAARLAEERTTQQAFARTSGKLGAWLHARCCVGTNHSTFSCSMPLTDS
jgi:hypothetical protein